ncbi:armadillo-type protein [Morchella snyderi]|nr:armadillo-type protein [Morchella snyderi]
MDDADRADFDLKLSLKHYLDSPATVPTPDAHPDLLDAESDPDSLSNAQLTPILEALIDSVAASPDAIARSSTLDSLQCLLKLFPTLPTPAIGKIVDLITSGLSAQADILASEIDHADPDSLAEHRLLLEIYGFLTQWAITAVEARAATTSSSTSSTATATTSRAKGKGKGKGAAAAAGAQQVWDSATHLLAALETMCKVLRLKLLRVFVTTSERDTFVSLFTRPAYVVLESEGRVKNTAVRMYVFKVLCIAVKHHGHAFGAQTSIVQNLTYFEHLSEPMAEFLQILSEQYDYPQLVDEILRELSNKEFNSNDTRGPKSVSGFIIKLSELAPRLVIKQMTLLIKLLDSDSYNLRCAVLEVLGNLILDLTRTAPSHPHTKAQMKSFFDVLEERFLDVNPYCRSKTIQVYITKLLDLDNKFPKRRQKAADLALRSLQDKSSNVRRNAVRLLARLVGTHPYGALHGGTLRMREWSERLEGVERELGALQPPPGMEGGAGAGAGAGVGVGEETVDPALLDDATMTPRRKKGKAAAAAAAAGPTTPQVQQMIANSEEISRLQLTRRYYTEAVRFIQTVHDASRLVCQLLGSKNKSEVVEAMDFFRVLDVHKVETAKDGIRRMLRLIWTKGNSDEGKGIQSHLIEVYKDLFFDAPDTFSPNETANFIARNMISLTFDTTAAELTCLEQLLSKMMKEGHVSDLVVHKLWQIYGVQKREISKNQRRGAIIVLGMLAHAEPEIVVRELETILRIGLGRYGRADLGLARYTCSALRHISPVGRAAKDATTTTMTKLPNDHAILVRLGALVELASGDKEWFGVAEQAISAIYALAKFPDQLCTDIIRRKTKSVFAQGPALAGGSGGSGNSREGSAAPPETPRSGVVVDADGDEDMMDAADVVMEDAIPAAAPQQQHNQPPGEEGADAEVRAKKDKAFALSQLLFIVGHVAIKQIVHLEIMELDFKKRKSDSEKNKDANPTPKKKDGDEKDELDLIGGTSEDDFTEAMAIIRERELLYGQNSLLANFGPLVAEICANNLIYKDRNLQAQSTLCMAKLMCVSAEYCETNLPLLITIMERSADPITRSNAVIALGDMAVCFNHLIDENTDFLYRRLNDPDASVKRTCLMTLTFLILAGQVKVKGQLGEMAKCLEDSDKRIADLSRMFFTELATKDNAVYNHFVDMFSLLSAERELEEDALRRIVKFLASFVEKDKHAKQLAEKLAARLGRCETERQWNDVAYALGLLQHKNEDIQKTIAAGFRVVHAAA